MAYGITPENEHHLVAQRDVRQFQVDAELNLGCVGQDVVGSGCSLLGAPKQDHRKVRMAATFILGMKVKGAGDEMAVSPASLLLLLLCFSWHPEMHECWTFLLPLSCHVSVTKLS